MLSLLRGSKSTKGPNQWSTASINPLPNVTPVTPTADGKIPQTSIDLSQASYYLKPSSKWTQVDQDSYDEEAKHQARESLIQSWKDRLSAISLITTFFAATEAQLLSAAANGNANGTSNLGNVANAGLTGALVIHSFAAIVSFLAAFFLISYTIREATHELKLELEPEHTDSIRSTDGHHHRRNARERSVVKHDTWIVQVCRFNASTPPVGLLERCNNLCMFLTATGFALEITAVLCFAWDKMGVGVSSLATGLTLFCIIASAVVVKPM